MIKFYLFKTFDANTKLSTIWCCEALGGAMRSLGGAQGRSREGYGGTRQYRGGAQLNLSGARGEPWFNSWKDDRLPGQASYSI